MNNHDIINDQKWSCELAENRRKAKLEIRIFAIGIVLLFAAFCSPVFFQYFCVIFLKG